MKTKSAQVERRRERRAAVYPKNLARIPTDHDVMWDTDSTRLRDTSETCRSGTQYPSADLSCQTMMGSLDHRNRQSV